MINTELEQGKLVTTSQKEVINIRNISQASPISSILWQRRFLIVGVSCVVMSAASFMAFSAKPVYRSSMQLLVNSNFDERELLTNTQEGALKDLIEPKLEAFNYTPQMRLIVSSKIIQKAVNSLRTEYPNITVEEVKGHNYYRKPLVVKEVEQDTVNDPTYDHVFELSFESRDPVKAQKVLQALQKAFRDYNIEQQKYRVGKVLTLVNDRLPTMQRQLQVSEEKLEKFRKKYNVFDPEIQGKFLLESLVDIKKQLQSTRAQLQDLQARHKNIENELASSSRSADFSSPLNQSLRSQELIDDIQKTELALAQERQRYTDDFPAVQKLIEQRQSQVELFRKEIQQSLPTLDKNIQASLLQAIDRTNAKVAQPINWEVLRRWLAEKTPVPEGARQPLLTKEQLKEVELRLAQQLIEVETTTKGLRANEKSLAESEQKISSELSKYPKLISEYNRLLPEVEVKRKQVEQLTQAQQSLGLKMSQTNFDWQVLEEPQRGIDVGSNRLLFIIGGAIAAPILGFAAALMGGLSNKVIYSPQELKKLTNLRILATVPKLKPFFHHRQGWRLPWKWGQTKADFKAAEIFDEKPFQQTLDMAYQNIQIIKSPFSFKSLMVTSAVPKEGKTTLALELAVSAARMHRRVLLVDANLHQPNLHKTLELSNDWGLSLLLVDEENTSFEDYIQPIHPSIDVLTAGSTTENTVKLLSSRRMKELVELFEQNYDLVLIDAPAILTMVDARILATFCNSIVMVARIGKVTQTQMIQATDILSNLNLIGIIANLAGSSHA
ncbi:AAA family ATPase [Chlorogloeopsis sp. ULAP01]|uniref:GumC family protein n=1 Tax=Chlorogloeopsis sp. ULAP01 TaxID=3056483 RepID=UPI0025AA3C6F|nr:tyrosine-protein kinase domain-containing protein [Chlorogloeopsis sp. ULAP01]MDM9381746.1 AAA family ATPase [Chlorogloeopsis sp. ULAP01]